MHRSAQLADSEGQAISSIYFTKNEQVAIISFSSGVISAYDVKASFAYLGDIQAEPLRTQQGVLAADAKVIEKPFGDRMTPAGLSLLSNGQ